MGISPKAPPVYKPPLPRLAAPPVYRPNQGNGPSAQLKPANHFRLETRPAPSVYEPQQVQSGVQPISASPFKLETRPAPPVYRPQEFQSGVQSKPARTFALETHPVSAGYCALPGRHTQTK